MENVKVSDLVPSTSTNVEGVFVGDLSPIKTSRRKPNVKYFEGQLSDGCKTVRFVSFEPKLHSKVNEAREDLRGISLKNCAVKRSRQGENELEVLVSSQTKIQNSPKKFKLDGETVKGDLKSNEIELEMLAEVSENQYVCLKGKVVSIFPIQEVNVKSSGRKLKKMDMHLANHTAVYRCVVWENHIKMIKDGKSYKFGNATIRTFNAAKFISLGKNCVIEEIDDIGDVVDDEVLEDGVRRANVVKADIVAMLIHIKVVAVVMERSLKAMHQLEFAASAIQK